MFSNKAEKATGERLEKAGRVPLSLISNDMKINGDIISAGEVQIDGNVIGDIQCAQLLIGDKARVEGQINALKVLIRGEVNGTIKADAVELAKTAKVTGDVWHGSLAIEAGAFLDGHCRRQESPSIKTKPSTVIGKENNPGATAKKAAPSEVRTAAAGT